jgi:hypothetical protein
MKRLWLWFVLTSPLLGQSYWDAPRVLETGTFAAAISVDSWATQRVMQRPNAYEWNPLAAPFVKHGAKGQAAASLLGFAVGIVPSYALHRAGKDRASRLWLHFATGGETLAAGYMLHYALR